MSRPSWDSYFFQIATEVSRMSTCDKKKVGAIIVNPDTKRIVSTGFNGSVSGLEHCTDKTKELCNGGCLNTAGRCIRAIHAEHNAILFAQQNLQGMHIYCTDMPCENCMKYINQVGITDVHYNNHYENEYTKYFSRGVTLHHKGGSK